MLETEAGISMGMIFSIAIIVLGIIQIIMIVKFFEIADNIKNIRRGFDALVNKKRGNIEQTFPNSTIETQKVNERKSEENPSKFTWQSWVAIIIMIVAAICYFSIS